MEVFSPAKINLFLHIKHLRDDGYHEIDSIFAKLNFGDVLYFDEKKEGIEIRASGKYKIPTNSDNLVYQAADLMRSRAKGKRGIKIHIEKNISVGSGLGGGSSNAATTLKYLNNAWDVHLPESELMDLGKNLGADVPFFLSDFSIARVGGIGEKISPVISSEAERSREIPLMNKRDFSTHSLHSLGRNDIIILIIPKYISISSAWAFSELKNFYNGKYPQEKNITNTFEEVIFQKYPDLLTIKKILLDSGAIYSSLSGSGSTVYGFFEEGFDIESLRESIGSKGELILCRINR